MPFLKAPFSTFKSSIKKRQLLVKQMVFLKGGTCPKGAEGIALRRGTSLRDTESRAVGESFFFPKKVSPHKLFRKNKLLVFLYFTSHDIKKGRKYFRPFSRDFFCNYAFAALSISSTMHKEKEESSSSPHNSRTATISIGSGRLMCVVPSKTVQISPSTKSL